MQQLVGDDDLELIFKEEPYTRKSPRIANKPLLLNASSAQPNKKRKVYNARALEPPRIP